MLYKRSSELFAQAKKVLPGGVNSPVRAFNAVGGDPIFIKEAKGAYLYDADGRRYIDYIASWGPLILGHAYPPVIEAVVERAHKGTSFGIPTEVEIRIAELAVKMVPHIDKIRFVNSGTEACMSAIRLARGYTGREKIIKFVGCYHGHADAFLIEAGSGGATFGSPNSPGVTQGTAKDTLLANYNDLTSVKTLFEANPEQIAAVIIEPVAGNMGCVPPAEGFLEGLRKLCTENGALLIFDEVMTGFRLAKGGAQEVFGIAADIVTFGKVIGGGLPVGAFAARAEVMDHLAPDGPVYQAGTLSGNPLAMSAGLAMLTALNEHPEVFDSLAKKTAYLHKGFDKVLNEAGIPHQINSFGSMLTPFFTDTPVMDFATSAKSDTERFKRYFHGMLAGGVYLPPSGFESYFLNDALTYDDLDQTIDALRKCKL
ncbi:glutamate-1-semialdehyde 2,1-aminomutase [Capnocytophaga haemolytica]|uniref:Glutamate-1-semialdehyde 2,1-aminomutase n=1 Tax=Capnocytophaga haemolytica TaxID=45243 RepID=A0AAX2GXL5_9FLAO|nr:glutamate-1-semialdehyde 2,1-aminomutase [Capnocytophaga haemolytica]AMD84540.1 glutamate-1-semialdehyde aminotransferase [Capnocytophaga haemolytica]SFN98725.1 glutamate-1-semialdehyde 2,1-aminomutase [Capnocytophaga haemolytica]SNV09474.1 Glutamate-1-semialdehyde 2,1-aminomutase [Capnocytophaga haemolytica]